MYNFADMHIHSVFSWDAEQAIEDVIEKAAKEKVSLLGMAEHFDFHYNHRDSYMFLDYQAYTDKVEKLREKFPALLKGLEVGEPYLHRDKFEKYIEDKKFDFFMGSVHWIGDVSPVEDRYFTMHKDVRDAYKVYFEEQYKLVSYGNFDIAPHITLVNRNGYKFYPEFCYGAFKSEIDAIIGQMIKNNIALEVNCSGLRMAAGNFIPDREIIEAYIKAGGDMITVGSDSHRIKQTFFGLEKAYKMLDEMGVKEITVFRKRKPEKIPLKVLSV